MTTNLLSPCTEWEGNRNPQGYGRLRIKGVKSMLLAHRWTWTQANGPIPVGMCVLHHCDNPPCVNLEHLYIGSHKDNARDMWQRGRAVKTSHGRQRGSKHGLSKLTEQQVLNIRAAITNGVTMADLARKYNVSFTSIRHIKIKRSWGWL